MSSSKHYLIVGAGLAGISVAWHLLKKGHLVTLIDQRQNKSSAIAAGMINPMVFRRMTKSWRADEFIPFATAFYKELEAEFNVSFFHPIVIRRIFSSAQERGFWEEKQQNPDFEAYLSPLSPEDNIFNKAHNPFGTGRVKSASYIDTTRFLEQALQYFEKNHTLISETFDHVSFDKESLTYKGKTYNAVIFCEGYSGKNNPLFSNLPLQQTKGETITVHCEQLKTSESLNRKCFILPLGEDQYRVGATYVWNTPNDEHTKEAQVELSEKFHVVSSHPFEITDQKAGIRPTTPDRRPFIGQHETHQKLFIFNGLGTKGYMSAPLLAYELCQHITEGTPLSAEVSITRFKKG